MRRPSRAHCPQGPGWDSGPGLRTPSLSGAHGSGPAWLHMGWGAAGWGACSGLDRWMHSQGQESEPARPAAQARDNSPSTPFPASLKLFLPWLSPRKDMGEQPRGGVIVGSRLPLRSTNSCPPPPQCKSGTIEKSVTYLQPAPDGPAPGQPAPQPSQGGEGTAPTLRAVYRPLLGPGKGPPGEQSPAGCPHNAAPMEPELREVWGLQPPISRAPSLCCLHSTHRHTRACTHTYAHTQLHTHTEAHDTHSSHAHMFTRATVLPRPHPYTLTLQGHTRS